jgi:Raf kinase inhibitor-like YbhB/YbcL family protein
MRNNLILTLLFLFCAACSKSVPETVVNVPPKPTQDSAQIKLISNTFKDGEGIPRQYTCDGVNISPPLEWSGVPKTVKTVAIIAEDPDAPSGNFVHWVLYNLPAENIGLVENVPATDSLKVGGFQGKNDFGKIGYGGPCPPSGTHRYFFKIYAVDSELPLKGGVTKADLLKAMEGHIVAQGQLMGKYR